MVQKVKLKYYHCSNILATQPLASLTIFVMHFYWWETVEPLTWLLINTYFLVNQLMIKYVVYNQSDKCYKWYLIFYCFNILFVITKFMYFNTNAIERCIYGIHHFIISTSAQFFCLLKVEIQKCFPHLKSNDSLH